MCVTYLNAFQLWLDVILPKMGLIHLWPASRFINPTLVHDPLSMFLLFPQNRDTPREVGCLLSGASGDWCFQWVPCTSTGHSWGASCFQSRQVGRISSTFILQCFSAQGGVLPPNVPHVCASARRIASLHNPKGHSRTKNTTETDFRYGGENSVRTQQNAMERALKCLFFEAKEAGKRYRKWKTKAVATCYGFERRTSFRPGGRLWSTFCFSLVL